MKMKTFLLFCCILSSCFIYAQDFNIKTFGAAGDSQTTNTTSIQKAIDAAYAKGGGRVMVPTGIYITGSIRLKDNVELYLEKGAVLKGSRYLSDYERNNRWYAIILAEGQKNISIKGEGTIDGNGSELVKNIIKLINNKAINDPRNQRRPNEYFRPQLIELTNCSHVEVKNITLRNSSCWVETYKNCSDLIIDSIHVESTTYWNNDGIDITDCKNVIVKNSFINSADDGICLKSEDPESMCENIKIVNCKVRSSASAVKLGTASAGGFKNISIDSIYVYDTYRTAIGLEIVDGGTMENISVNNVTAVNTGGAIFIRLGQRNKKVPPGIIKGIEIKNMNVEVPEGKPDKGYQMEGPVAEDIYPHNILPSSITGLPGHPVQDVSLENIYVSYGGGAQKSKAYIPIDSLENVPEKPHDYPEYSMFGELPSWGLYVRHASDINLKNVEMKYVETDFRPAMVFDDVNHLSITDLKIPTAKILPVIVLKGVTDMSFREIKIPGNNKKSIIKMQ